MDTVLGAGTELGLRGVAKVGGAMWERALLKAAQKTESGRAVAEKAQTRAFQTLEESVVGRNANVRGAYETFMEKIGNIPKGKGATGKRLAGPVGGDIGALADDIAKDLRTSTRTAEGAPSVGQVEVLSAGYGRPPMGENLLPPASSITKEVPWTNTAKGFEIPGLSGVPLVDVTKQPMDALIRMHSSANKIAWGVNADAPQAARVAAKEFAEDLNKIILTKLNPKEREVFEAAKAITKESQKYSAGVELARYIVRKSIVGSIGGAVGYQQGGREGAAVGSLAAIGGAVGLEALEKKYAPMLLESWIQNNKATYQKAISRLMDEGVPLATVGDQITRSLSRAVPIEVLERVKEDMMAPSPSQQALAGLSSP
jgi:hypothetical protein